MKTKALKLAVAMAFAAISSVSSAQNPVPAGYDRDLFHMSEPEIFAIAKMSREPAVLVESADDSAALEKAREIAAGYGIPVTQGDQDAFSVDKVSVPDYLRWMIGVARSGWGDDQY